MASKQQDPLFLQGLNEPQRLAVEHGDDPLLIVAGAGTGKTKTLVHRVAQLIARGIDPARILLMTFTRRAAQEMLGRVEGLLNKSNHSGDGSTRQVWGGTFHATATRLLRIHGEDVGLSTGFLIHDRADSEDFIDVLRTELGFDRSQNRFPKKGTCFAIHSNCVNSQRPLKQVLADHFPWCASYEAELQELFRLYGESKDQSSVLDYDDLLLFFRGLLANDGGALVRNRFDCVLVDEYQDTNSLQADIVRLLRPDGRGLTAVGDDAQSIYSFRAASVHNIIEFPQQFPGTRLVKLEQNYRSTPAILKATNAVIAAARQGHRKELWSQRDTGAQPQLLCCFNESSQAEYVADRVLAHREEGVALKRQAVLFRAAHHALLLESELTRRQIPYVKYGGLKFLEAAHIKDLMAILRLAENPRDLISGMRVLQLLPGVGPRTARKLAEKVTVSDAPFAAWYQERLPTESRQPWTLLLELLEKLRVEPQPPLSSQIRLVRDFYDPCLERLYDSAPSRLQDLKQMEVVADRFGTRQTMLAELALDPPNSTEDLAADTHLDEDYLVLSTIHSAKGLEWNSVYVIHAADGNIPSDMAVKNEDQVEEERRLLYVALTRAIDHLYVCYPQRYQQGFGVNADRYGLAQVSRFLQGEIGGHFRHTTPPRDGNFAQGGSLGSDAGGAGTPRTPHREAKALRKEIRHPW